MAYHRTNRRTPTTIGFNATPMIDVIFLLTIFFMLVSTFASKEHVPMDLPKPAGSQARDVKVADRVIINCTLAEGDDQEAGRVLYQVGANPPATLEVLSRQLAALKSQSNNLQALIRADRNLMYQDIRAAMQVIAANNIQMLNLAAHTRDGG